jgi:DNA-binding CsgD family transcriptional regulator
VTDPPDLTPAERRALEAVGQYGSVKIAAYMLGRSPRTIEAQLANARSKLGADSTLQAVLRLAGIGDFPRS